VLPVERVYISTSVVHSHWLVASEMTIRVVSQLCFLLQDIWVMEFPDKCKKDFGFLDQGSSSYFLSWSLSFLFSYRKYISICFKVSKF
jgi:hypothetical protein